MDREEGSTGGVEAWMEARRDDLKETGSEKTLLRWKRSLHGPGSRRSSGHNGAPFKMDCSFREKINRSLERRS